MKKNIICFILALFLTLCLSSCSEEDKGSSPIKNENEPRESVTESETLPHETAVTEDSLPALPNEYASIINNLINAFPWKVNNDIFTVPASPELSYMYIRNTALSQVGFAIYDLDGNGQKELIISDLGSSVIYDVYTIENGKAVQVLSAGERYRFYLFENCLMENQWSGGAAVSGSDFFRLTDGKLVLEERIGFDVYAALNNGWINDISEATDTNCFFRSKTDNEEDYVQISSDDAIKSINDYRSQNKPLTLKYTPLSLYR